uniref:Uncharacterized protein n=1 Tax=Panagrolaimus sp. ES5 TaxID=591445 RepID=A0AC34GY22_9BILA
MYEKVEYIPSAEPQPPSSFIPEQEAFDFRDPE